MMLETVKQYIQNLPDCPFSEFFEQYVIKVQDSNLEREIESLRRQNILNLHVMDTLIHQQMEEMST